MGRTKSESVQYLNIMISGGRTRGKASSVKFCRKHEAENKMRTVSKRGRRIEQVNDRRDKLMMEMLEMMKRQMDPPSTVKRKSQTRGSSSKSKAKSKTTRSSAPVEDGRHE